MVHKFETKQDTARPLRILVAEGDEKHRSRVSEALRRDGCEVVEVHDAVDAMDYLAQTLTTGNVSDRLDLILSELWMPVFSGLDLLARIRRAPWAVPVVLFADLRDDQNTAEAQRLGAAAILDRGCELEALRHVVSLATREARP